MIFTIPASATLVTFFSPSSRKRIEVTLPSASTSRSSTGRTNRLPDPNSTASSTSPT
jgi:hypothetical protein